MSIFQYELNEHRDKTQNQTPHMTTNNTTSQVDDEITKTQKQTLDICEKTFI